jgi:hypothetical protein
MPVTGLLPSQDGNDLVDNLITLDIGQSTKQFAEHVHG